MYEASINNRHFKILQKGSSFIVDDQELILDLERIDKNSFHVLKGFHQIEQSYLRCGAEGPYGYIASKNGS